MAHKLSRSIEDYIKAIYVLQSQHKRATTQRISEELNVKKASVTGMVKHLAAEGFVKHEPYKGAQLTRKGREVAIDLLRRHRLIELFLNRTLGVAWDELHQDAEILEHAFSDRLIERIAEYLGHPEFDPHGQPIPQANGEFPDHRGVSLEKLEPGMSGEVVEVTDTDAGFLRYLTSLKIGIGTRLKVEEKAPYQGPITLSVGRSRTSLGPDAARRIWVAPQR